MQPRFFDFRTLHDQLILLFVLLCAAVCTILLTAWEFSFPFVVSLDQHGNPNAFFGLLFLFLLIAALLRPLLWQMGGHSQPALLFSLLTSSMLSYLCGWTGICVAAILLARFLIRRG